MTEAPRLVIPDGLPPKWQPIIRPYLPLFDAFRQLREQEGIDWVSGDTGMGTLFAFSPFDCVDVCPTTAAARLWRWGRNWPEGGQFGR